MRADVATELWILGERGERIAEVLAVYNIYKESFAEKARAI